MNQKYRLVASGPGNVVANNASPVVGAIAGIAGKSIRLTCGVVNVTAAAVGGGGVVNLGDGVTVIMKWDANAVGSYPFNFNDGVGYPLSAGNNLLIQVTGAVTTQATANITATGYFVG